MRKEIFKYQIKTIDEQKIHLPINAKILTLQLQLGEPCIWAEVNPQGYSEVVTLLTFGTGHPIPEGCTYIGTYQRQQFVFHVYRADTVKELVRHDSPI